MLPLTACSSLAANEIYLFEDLFKSSSFHCSFVILNFSTFNFVSVTRSIEKTCTGIKKESSKQGKIQNRTG